MRRNKAPWYVFLLPEIILGLFTFAFLALFAWVLWVLWCFVMPALWVGGPEAILNPGYWVFFGALALFRIITLMMGLGRLK